MSKIRKFGIEAIFNIYDLKLLIKGGKIPLFLSAIFIIVLYLSKNEEREVLIIIVDLILSIIPNLLGFVLSGYALLIGFGNVEIIAKQNSNNEDATLYQKLSSVFSIGLLFQIAILVIGIILKVLLKLDLTCVFESFCICKMLNYFLIFILFLSFLYATILIKDLVINIFNFSQAQHFKINKKAGNQNQNISD